MTEQEWLRGTDPAAMLAFLRGRVSRRKRRLFACACCRGIWHLIQDDRSRRALEVAERHADGLASEGELESARADARAAAGHGRGESPGENRAAARAVWAAAGRARKASGLAARAAGLAAATAARGQARSRLVGAGGKCLAAVPPELAPAVWQALSLPCWWAVRTEQVRTRSARTAAATAERQRQSDLLRELIGNPFRPVRLDVGRLPWGGADVARLARVIDEEAAYDRLPILGDALEEAGCADEAILNHCRASAAHTRGCWALDLLLGNK